MVKTPFPPMPLFGRVIALGSILAASAISAQPITTAMADRSIAAFNTVYWNAAGKYIYKLDNRTGRLDFWMTAEAWEMVMDVYVRTRTPASLQQIGDLYDGFVQNSGTNWTTNAYNDDIMWWVLACTRAYDLTGNVRYRDQAKLHFDWIWSTQTDNVFGGGIWWQNTQHLTKNSCIVQPAIIAAANLARILGDNTYRVKADTLYAWQKRTLTATNGKVYDAINNSGTQTFSTTYNQGTFIGAALALGHLADAEVCATWTRANMCDANGVLRNTSQGDAATFNQICIRYVIVLARVPGHQTTMTWMETNGNYAWNNRRTSDDIMGYNWAAAAPGSGIESQGAAGGVALLNLLATPIVSLAPPSRMRRLSSFSGGNTLGRPGFRYRYGIYAADGSKF